MDGAGILRAPADVAARLPSPAFFLAIWVVGGLYALLGANALSELAAISIVFGESIAALVGVATARWAPAIGAAAVVVGALVLARGVTAGDRTQRWTSALKAIALLALIVACFAVVSPRPAAPAAP